MAAYQENWISNSPALQSLETFMTRAKECPPESFEDFEQELREKTAAVERECLEQVLAGYDVDHERIEFQGKRYRRGPRAERPYMSQAGRIRVLRQTYVPCDGVGRSISPMELQAGIIDRFWTPNAARIATTAVGLMPPRECQQLFAEFGGMQPSPSSLDRLPKIVSKQWEKKRLEFEETLRCSEELVEEAVSVAISIDGVLAPMKDGARAEKRCQKDKRPKGPAGYQEVGCGTISLLGLEGENLQTLRYARMPEKCKRTVKQWLLDEVTSIKESMPGVEFVFLSDGAPDHWDFADQLEEHLGLEDMPRALDAFHVLERLKKALDAYDGEGSAKAKGAFEELRQRLLEEPDGVEAVLRALRYRRGKRTGAAHKVIAEQINYFETGRDRMRYCELRERQLPIGSGTVEAACKTLVTQRMKRSGMSWRHRGGEAVLTIRSLQQSARWNQGWKLIAAEFVKPVFVAA